VSGGNRPLFGSTMSELRRWPLRRDPGQKSLQAPATRAPQRPRPSVAATIARRSRISAA
jgi:hypothetical protein